MRLPKTTCRWRGHAVCALAVGLCAAVPAEANISVTIEMRPRVAVRQPRVTLGDIAYLTTGDLALLRRLMAIPLGAAPRPGAVVSVGRETVARWVTAHTGLAATAGAPAVRWTGAPETEVESPAQQVAGEEVVGAARGALSAWLARRSVRAEVQAVSAVRDLVLPVGTVTLQVRPLPESLQPGRRMQVWVDAAVDGRFVRAAAVSFEVAAWAERSVASASLASGAPLDPLAQAGALTRQAVELTALRAAPVADPPLDPSGAAPQGQRLRRGLKPGEVLTAAHLEAAPAVARGTWAQLDARAGEVVVQSRAEVLQDGRVGDTVRVKVANGSGPVLARVVAPGQVEVRP